MEKIGKLIGTVTEMLCGLRMLEGGESICQREWQLTPYRHPFSLFDPDNHRNQKHMVVRGVFRVRWPEKSR